MRTSFNEKFYQFFQKDGTYIGDFERCALFYIISTNVELTCYIDRIYDFNKGVIIPNSVEGLPLSSSATALLTLAFNLFNSNNKADVYSTFCNLDNRNFEVAMNAIKIRFH